MIKSKYAWDIKHPESKITDDIASKYKLTPIVKKILESKGLIDANTIESYFLISFLQLELVYILMLYHP